MADLVITGANVLPGSDAQMVTDYAGEAIAQGKAVYFSSTTKRWMLADNDSATLEARVAGGIALCAAAAGQPIVIHKSGDIVIGAGLTPGTPYYLSSTPGGICPVADLGAGKTVCQLGIARSATTLALNIIAPGVTL